MKGVPFLILFVAVLEACSASGPSEPSPAIYSSRTTAAREERFPEFPWGPPKPSGLYVIPSRLLVSAPCKSQLRDVADTLEEALSKAGYNHIAWYSLPDGFAAVTGLERIDSDGSPLTGADRWAEEFTAPGVFSIRDYLSALFTARMGHYRVIVFAVTDLEPNFTDAPSSIEVKKWSSRGEYQLPKELGTQQFTAHHVCRALIYEFECSGSDRTSFKDPSSLAASVHLKKSLILEALGGEK